MTLFLKVKTADEVDANGNSFTEAALIAIAATNSALTYRESDRTLYARIEASTFINGNTLSFF